VARISSISCTTAIVEADGRSVGGFTELRQRVRPVSNAGADIPHRSSCLIDHLARHAAVDREIGGGDNGRIGPLFSPHISNDIYLEYFSFRLQYGKKARILTRAAHWGDRDDRLNSKSYGRKT
jgi:hypothetical protein